MGLETVHEYSKKKAVTLIGTFFSTLPHTRYYILSIVLYYVIEILCFICGNMFCLYLVGAIRIGRQKIKLAASKECTLVSINYP